MRNLVPSWRCRLVFLFLMAGLMTVPLPSRGQNGPVGSPGQEYAITPTAGPWLILVTSYRGPEAGKFAHDLCAEIRGRYKIPAYTFDFGAEKKRERHEELNRRKAAMMEFLKDKNVPPSQLPKLKTYRVEDEFGVLVGGYKDMDSARKDLDRIKKLDAPKTVPLNILTLLNPDEGNKGKSKEEKSKVNPFGGAFVVRNPTIKFEQEPEKLDTALLKDLNAHETYSLLQVKKPWTLVVKDYYGQTVIQPQSAPNGFMKKLLGEKKMSMLDAGAHDAHEVVRGLRAVHMEAYVLHTRWGSIVTVGAYDSQDDPRLLQNQRNLAKFKFGQPPVQFMAVPLPMPVPQL